MKENFTQKCDERGGGTACRPRATSTTLLDPRNSGIRTHTHTRDRKIVYKTAIPQYRLLKIPDAN